MKTRAELEKRIAELEGRVAQLEAQAKENHYHYHYYPPVYSPPPVSIPSVWDGDSFTVPYRITTTTRPWTVGDPVTPNSPTWMTCGNAKE